MASGQTPLETDRNAINRIEPYFSSSRGANESRECAPDDMLRDEAIQDHAFVGCECACWTNCGIFLRETTSCAGQR
jgi:hypothetical protein